ncbi:CDP-glucose 4,6-dehydratase [Wukongibacter baidiensis]|uniref:CDP-glucose 4,6-dehydratase n=1 Tax=Wukongibacter baidiensis TaxID=1723361 RepID=UPI003D7FC22F
MNKDFWKKKKVLITGHTGFKGSWLSIWLLELGAEVIGYALPPYTSKDNFVLSNLGSKIVDIRGDIRDYIKLKGVFDECNPEIVFHLAAQPLVRESYKNPLETYQVNVMGTVNTLECIRTSKSAQIGVMITSDKCYENKEQVWGYRENDELGGYDPYSSSKGCSELVIKSWRNSFMNPSNYAVHGKSIASVRAGNVIGGGDWSKDRIVPDCIRASEENRDIKLRNPNAIRPWQHVLEPLCGYLLLAEKLQSFPKALCGAWNFGPTFDSVITVKELAERIVRSYGKGEVLSESKGNTFHETNLLTLDISKATRMLGWYPKLDIEQTIDLTVDWYKNYKKADLYDLCKKQINNYMLEGDED